MDLEEEIIGESMRIDDESAFTQTYGTPTAQSAPEIVDIDPPCVSARGAHVPLDLLVRSLASAIEQLLKHEAPPLAILERLAAQAVLDGPPDAHGAAVELLRSSLALRGIDIEPADVVQTLINLGGGQA